MGTRGIALVLLAATLLQALVPVSAAEGLDCLQRHSANRTQPQI
jgi:hypothetical protein